MKKRLFYLFALICSVSLFTACSDDDDNGGEAGTLVSPYAGTYRLADYETQDVTVPGENGSEDKVIKNIPVGGALYFDWVLKESDAFVDNINPLVRYLGSSILPAALGTVTLDENGDVLADYIEKPVVEMDMQKIMMIFLGYGEYPSKEEVKSKFPTSGFVSSAKGLAAWSESNGTLTLKLNIANILADAMEGADTSGIAELIEQLLSNSTPAEIKALLGTLLGGADLSGIQDATITQLVGWVKDGIPMELRTNDNGHTIALLDKSAFDNLFTLRETGELDEYGQPVQISDILILWDALITANLIPEDVQMAGLMIGSLSAYWEKTTTFDVGLDLVKK